MDSIFLKKIETPDVSKLEDLHEVLSKYITTYQKHNGLYLDEIKKLRAEVEETYRKSIWEEEVKRFNEINKTLYKYWKVSKVDDIGHMTPLMYLFPYKLIKGNKSLMTLCSFINPIYNDHNGLYESLFDIMGHPIFKDNDLLFEESTEDEMMNNAKEMCEKTLSDRLYKLKYRDNVLD